MPVGLLALGVRVDVVAITQELVDQAALTGGHRVQRHRSLTAQRGVTVAAAAPWAAAGALAAGGATTLGRGVSTAGSGTLAAATAPAPDQVRKGA